MAKFGRPRPGKNRDLVPVQARAARSVIDTKLIRQHRLEPCRPFAAGTAGGTSVRHRQQSELLITVRHVLRLCRDQHQMSWTGTKFDTTPTGLEFQLAPPVPAPQRRRQGRVLRLGDRSASTGRASSYRGTGRSATCLVLAQGSHSQWIEA